MTQKEVFTDNRDKDKKTIIRLVQESLRGVDELAIDIERRRWEGKMANPNFSFESAIGVLTRSVQSVRTETKKDAPGPVKVTSINMIPETIVI